MPVTDSQKCLGWLNLDCEHATKLDYETLSDTTNMVGLLSQP